MERTIKTTSDGSKTLYIKELDENYHSHHGALNEANHVFIKNGLNLINLCEINILELGFGTGLNVLVTFNEYLKNTLDDKYHKNFKINYFTAEKYPINPEEIAELNYDSLFDKEEVKNLYKNLHNSPWEKLIELAPGFSVQKIKIDFFDLKDYNLPEIDLVYFDCFGSRVQPDLWEIPLFEIVANKMKDGGLLTTYASKGSVRRNLQSLGFVVEKKPGPPGKREMINAILKREI